MAKRSLYLVFIVAAAALLATACSSSSATGSANAGSEAGGEDPLITVYRTPT